MKKQTALLLSGLFFLGISFSATAQINTGTGGAVNVLPNIVTTNTNVGIGTDTPVSKLDVEGSVSIGSTYSGTIAAPVNGAIIEGNVGIGTATPKAVFEVRGSLPDGQVFTNADDRNNKSIVLNLGSTVDPAGGWRMIKFFDFPQSNINPKSELYFALEDRGDFNRFRFTAEKGGYTQMEINNRNQEELMKINENGNDNVTMTLSKPNSFLGIGTSSFIDGTDTYKLSVNGNIRAHRVRVYTNWADYVFEKNYKLPTLQEVEKHINDKGHLLDIPSAKEVEEKGIELGEMNKLLLQKVEELTLYMIKMNKELQEVKVQLKNK